MKNIILLGLFFLGVGVMYAHYFVPNIERQNNIDQLETLLKSVKEAIPPGQKVYFLSEESFLSNPEIYYKVQFSLAPRVVVASKYGDVPTGSFMVEVQDKKLPAVSVPYPDKDKRSARGDRFFNVSLLKKTP